MHHQKKLSRHNSKQSSMGETASLGSAKSAKSNASNEHQLPTSTSNGTSKSRTSIKDQEENSNQAASANILNVAEMLLHGVADNEILDIWLRSIQCEEFVAKFTEAGYDMPTISRITPQDLTAIGVTDPTKRLKILSEIKKLNLQDGLPNFRPSDLSHWLRLIRLDSYYYQSLCDQQVDTIEKLCQLTWEDFEELGITRLGHQKRIQLAIERLKEMEGESNNSKFSKKPVSEPIYDTNPSQILLVASAENHSMNGPIINKQSSTSELSSTGSGSLHSVYSAASTQYQQSNYGPIPDMSNNHHHQQLQHQQSEGQISNISGSNNMNQQAIYSQPPPPPLLYQQQQQQHQPNSIQPQPQPTPQLPNQSHPYAQDCLQMGNGIGTISQQQQNRQSMNMLPFSALARLPKHQQQLLQQSSIYATLSRQPSTKPKQPPPPVPIRTNSLKPNSLQQQAPGQQQQQTTPQHQPNNNNFSSQMSNCNTSSTNSLYRSSNNMATLANNRNGQGSAAANSQTMTLTKNKSFSGNAHMEASRARFLNRNSQQQFQLHQQQQQQQQQIQAMMAHNNNTRNQNNFIYGIQTNGGFDRTNSSDRVMFSNQTSCPSQFLDRPQPPKMQNGGPMGASLQQQSLYHHHHQNDPDFDVHSDTQSTKSLIATSPASSLITSPVDNNSSPGQSSGSSQTLYNSASSGSNDQSLNIYNFSGSQASAASEQQRQQNSASSCTLNDANLILDSEQQQQQQQARAPLKSATTTNANFSPTKSTPQKGAGGVGGGTNGGGSNQAHCNATTGKDDDFPPPPSPLSLADFDGHDLVSLNQDANFTDANHRLMTFCVGI